MRVLSADLNVFGDGPDGGREATVEGPLPYPNATAGWDGYTVLQAKFKQDSGGAARDLAWLSAQLRREVKSYQLDGRRRPDYLILATNVRLTAVQDSGTKDRFHEQMAKAARDLDMRGWSVWDFDELRAFLDNNRDVRSRYFAWIAPGDVLQQLATSIDGATPEFESTLVTYLQKELLSDQYVNLEQAGHSADDKIPLGRVFTDLPVRADDLDLGEQVGVAAEVNDRRFVARMVEAGNLMLASEAAAFTGRSPHDGRQPAATSRVVALGGPGQGKSTLGQFLCQLHRARLLTARDAATISPEARLALDAILRCVAEDDLEMPTVGRFPLRIVLNSYASALSRPDGPRGLLDYVVACINERTGADLSLNLFKRWLAAHPWLIVLDGLDEVPASSNRDEVLASISDFWVDVAVAASDVFVIATSRPQGYNAEFSPGFYRHLRLSPLEIDSALRYGTRLAETRYGRDNERFRKVVARLERAALDDAARRLMTSPLQVTIMTALVDQMGQPPRDRWSLFHEYYRTIYKREMERDSPAAAILRDLHADVDAIHQRVALLLQVKSGLSEQPEVRLSPAQLRELIEQRLVEEGHRGSEMEKLRDAILEAAGNRLVFLVGLEHGRVGFEIRSLQEFMAAECLMEGEDRDVRARLASIAGITHWRNVFLFAVGFCFAKRQYLRDVVFTVCMELNTRADDPLARRRLAGSLLAADLLLDGPVKNQPKYRNLLGNAMTDLFRQMPSPSHARVTEAFDTALEPIVRQELDEVTRATSPLHCLGAWQCLLRLDPDEAPWARKMAEERWPNDLDQERGLIYGIDHSGINDWAKDLILRRIPAHPIALALEDRDGLRGLRDVAYTSPWLNLLQRTPRRSEKTVNIVGRSLSKRDLVVPLVGMNDSQTRPTLRFARDLHPTWLPLVVGDNFGRHPSAASLSRGLRNIAASVPASEWSRCAAFVPWPFGLCLVHARTRAELEALADAARAGAFADAVDWEAAEEAWQSRGLAEEALMRSAAALDAPFDRRMCIDGSPSMLHLWQVSAGATVAAFRFVRRLHGATRSESTRGVLSPLLAALASLAVSDGLPSQEQPDVELFASWLSADSHRRWIGIDGIAALPSTGSADRDAEALHEIGVRCFLSSTAAQQGALAARVAELLPEHPDLPGLWMLIAADLPTQRSAAMARARALVRGARAPAAAAGRAIKVLVELIDGDAPVDVDAVAETIAAGASADGAIAASVLEQCAGALRERDDYERLIAALDEQVATDAVAFRATTAWLCEEALRRRPSPLQDPDVWRDLALFNRNEEMLLSGG